jgi:hypothetical protein
MSTGGSLAGGSAGPDERLVCILRDPPLNIRQTLRAVTEYDDDGVPVATIYYDASNTAVALTVTELATMVEGECDATIVNQRSIHRVAPGFDAAVYNSAAPPQPIPAGAVLHSLTVKCVGGALAGANQVGVAIGANPTRPMVNNETVTYNATNDDGTFTDPIVVTAIGSATAIIDAQYRLGN